MRGFKSLLNSLLIIGCTLLPSILRADIPIPSDFSHITSQNGLPQNTIRAIYQDTRSLMWFGTDDGLVRFDGYDLKVYRRDLTDVNSLTDSYISAISEDTSGNLLVGTLGGGLHLMNVTSERFQKLPLRLPDEDVFDIQYSLDGKYLIGTGKGVVIWDGNTGRPVRPLPIKDVTGNFYTGKIKSIVEDGHKRIWLATGSQGLAVYSPEHNTTKWFLAEKTPITTLFKDHSSQIWIGSEAIGLGKANVENEAITFDFFDTKNSHLPANDIMSLDETPDNELVIGTWGGGLAVMDKARQGIRVFKSRKEDPNSLVSNLNMSIFAGNDGKVWFGSYDKGVSLLNPDLIFRNFRTSSDLDVKLPSDLIWAFGDDGQNLWVGTAEGSTRINLKEATENIPDSLVNAPEWQELNKMDTRSILVDGTTVWLGTKKQGLYRLNTETGEIENLEQIALNNEKLPNRSVRLLLKDSQNRLWIGTQSGLSRFNPENDTLHNFPKDSLPHYRIRALYEDDKDRIWVGTPEGLSLYQNDTEDFKHWKHDPTKPNETIAGPMVQSIVSDNAGQLWIGTTGGITIFDPETGTVKKNIRTTDGMPSSGVYGLLYSGNTIWASTMRGLVKIDLTTYQVDSYFAEDGLPDNEFNFNAFKKLRNGTLLFGTVSGFTSFKTDDRFQEENHKHKLWASLHKGDEIVHADMEIREDKDRLTLTYGVYNFDHPNSVLYRYRLSGPYSYESEWGLKREQEFVHLPSGHYTIQIEARNKHDKWQVESDEINFTVSPPFLQSPVAFGVYILGFTGLMIGGAKLNRIRLQRRNTELEQLLEAKASDLVKAHRDLHEEQERRQKLHDTQRNMFRALTHELKTPLSVASSIIQAIADKEKRQDAKTAKASLIKLNSLLSRIMDVSQSEQVEQSHIRPVSNLGDILSEVTSTYEPLASIEQKILRVSSLDTSIEIPLSAEQLSLCVGNLISNAIKYTSDKGMINVHVQVVKENVRLLVKDNGTGINAEQLPHIWEWFKQGDNDNDGWGVGLAFVKETVEGCGGKIDVTSQLGEGSEFVLTLPIVELPEARIKQLSVDTPVSILIVEDDPDLRNQFQQIFPQSWTVETLSNTEQVDQELDKSIPDMILTDLMMPGEDGLSFVKRLRDRDETANIPVVMLTAYNDVSVQKNAYKLGVDSFIAKPFDNDVLVTRVSSIVAKRKKLFAQSKHFLLSGMDFVSPHAENPAESFLEKLHAATQDIYELPNLSLKMLAERMAIGERTLQRRFDETGMSWTEYKTVRRLRFAMQLLKDPNMKIVEVADQLGFSSAAHFSKAFKAETDQSPSVWRKNT